MLRLNLNERADSVPEWLPENFLARDSLWQYRTPKDAETSLAQQFQLSSEQVLLSNGGDEAIELLFKFAKLNDKRLLLPLPLFSQYWHGVSTWQVAHQFFDARTDLRVDIAAVIDAIQEDDIVVLTSPNNPTGERLRDADVFAVVEKANACGAWVFLDEAYCDFSDDVETYLSLLSQNVLLLRTFSKAYGLAGVRLGYVLGHRDCVSELRRLSMPFNVSCAGLSLLEVCLNDDAQREVRDYCTHINRNRQTLSDALSEKGFEVFVGQGNFVFFQGERVKCLAQAFTEQDILVKTDLVGLNRDNTSMHACRLTIPFDLAPVVSVLNALDTLDAVEAI